MHLCVLANEFCRFIRFYYMIDKKAITDVVNEALEQSDAFLVDVTVSGDNRIVVEIDSFSSVSIDDCVRLNDIIEAHFDRDVEDYELEVGSAGLTSPLRVKAQYDKNIGNPVEVLTADGRKLKGELKAATDSDFTIVVSRKVKPEGAKRPVMVDEDITLKYDEIKYTKYLIEF